MTDTVMETPIISAEEAAAILNQPLMSTIQWALFQFGFRGLSPIMFDRMTAAQVLGLITGQKVDYPKDEPLEVKALRKMYSDVYVDDMPAGKLGFPHVNLYASLRDAGEVVQYGSGANDRITLSTKGTLLYYMIRLHEPFYPVLGLDGNPAEWEIDLRKGNATQGRGAVGIVRSRVDEWGVVGHMDVNIDELSPEKAEELITKAGIKQGLCSARPSKKMSFGQFALTHFKWIGGADPRKVVRRSSLLTDTDRVPTPSSKKAKTSKGKKATGRNRLKSADGNGDVGSADGDGEV